MEHSLALRANEEKLTLVSPNRQQGTTALLTKTNPLPLARSASEGFRENLQNGNETD